MTKHPSSGHPSSGTNDIDDALGTWLLAHDRGLSEAEALAFDRWLAASPAHALAWAETAPLWESFDHAAHDPELRAMLADARSAGRSPRTRALRWGSAVLAGGAALAAALWLAFMPARTPTTDARQFATGLAPQTYRLADGTQLTLDAQSSLSFVMDGGDRRAVLSRGGAYFDVHHDAAHPFSVSAAGATITDVGTRFGVASDAGVLLVTLVSGKVAIADPATGKAAITLVPGQQFRRVGNAPGTTSAIDPDAALSWREGYLEFDRTPVTTAVAEMNRYTANPLRIGDPAVGQFRVSGRFRANDPERFALLLGYTYPVQLVIDDHGRPVLRLK